MGGTEENHINEIHGKTPVHKIEFVDFFKETYQEIFKPYLKNNMFKFGKKPTATQDFEQKADETIPLLCQAIIDKNDKFNNFTGLKFVINALEELEIKNNFNALHEKLGEKQIITKKLKI